MTHRWLAVRCCCKPEKVLGFIKLAEAKIRPFSDPTIVLFDKDGVGHQARIDKFTDYGKSSAIYFDPGANPCASIPIFEDEIAIRTDDRPIEFWRTIEGFMEVAHEEKRKVLYGGLPEPPIPGIADADQVWVNGRRIR